MLSINVAYVYIKRQLMHAFPFAPLNSWTVSIEFGDDKNVVGCPRTFAGHGNRVHLFSSPYI